MDNSFLLRLKRELTPETLDRWSYDEDPSVRRRVAQNPNTSPETLDRLSYDENPHVRFYVAGNPNALPEIIDRMADDENWGIRLCIAQNPNTPQYLKDYLNVIEFFKRYQCL